MSQLGIPSLSLSHAKALSLSATCRIGHFALSNFHNVSPGSLYPALKRLERDGWITSAWERDARNREMKFYRLTEEGKKQLTLEESRWRQIVRAMSRRLPTA